MTAVRAPLRAVAAGYLLPFALLAAAYFALAVVGLQWAALRGAGSPVWPAAGMALAGLLLGGVRLWPAIVVARLAAAWATGSEQQWWAEVVIAFGNALSTVLPALALRYWLPIDIRLTTMRDVLRLTLAAAAGAAVGAGLGAATLKVSSGLSLGAAATLASDWWFGSTVGVFVIAPLVLAWSERSAWNRPPLRWALLAALLGATVTLSYLIFLENEIVILRTWYVYPALIAVAVTFHVPGTALALLIVTTTAVWGATAGTGPFAVIFESMEGRVSLAQHFATVTSFAGLVLAAAADERRGAEALRRSEALLRESEDHYRHFVELNPQITWTANSRGRLLEISPRWLDWTGLSPKELTATRSAAYIHPDDRQDFVSQWRKSVRSGRPLDVEARIRMKDGSWRWMRSRAFPRYGGHGAVTKWYGHTEDVHLRRLAENEVLAERDRATRYLEVAGVMFIVLDTDARVRTINRRGIEILGYTAASELAGRDWFEAAMPKEDDQSRRTFNALISGAVDGLGFYESEIVRTDGTRRVIEWRSVVLRDETHRVTGLVISGDDVTGRRAAERQVEYLARHDSLTGLPNRNLFSERLAEAVANADGVARRAGLVLLDLDHFKTVNDTLGHPAGDHLLNEVARWIEGSIRKGDTAARIGGDEFAILFPDATSRQEVEDMARRVCDSVVRPAQIDGQTIEVTASLGVAVAPDDGVDPDILMRHADLALYDAKQCGRYHVSSFNPGLAEAAARRALVEMELRHAINRNELELHYQPQVNLDTGRIQAAEALVRWRRGGDLVMPGEFIAIAEASGAIRPLGAWVLAEACRQQARWRDAGTPITVAVNVSPAETSTDDFSEALDRALDGSGIDSRMLELEITEGLLIEHERPSVRTFLNACQERNIRLAIDDFGTGYSSLGYLGRLPIEKIKIDRSFVWRMDNSDGETLVDTIVTLGHQLRKRVVAEGVETQSQLDHLLEVGCDDVQGNLVCRPVDAATLTDLMREREILLPGRRVWH